MITTQNGVHGPCVWLSTRPKKTLVPRLTAESLWEITLTEPTRSKTVTTAKLHPGKGWLTLPVVIRGFIAVHPTLGTVSGSYSTSIQGQSRRALATFFKQCPPYNA